MKLSYGKRSMMTSYIWQSPNRTKLGHKSAIVPFVYWFKSPYIKGLSIFIKTSYTDNFRTLLTLFSEKNHVQTSWNSSFSCGRFSCLRNYSSHNGCFFIPRIDYNKKRCLPHKLSTKKRSASSFPTHTSIQMS